MTVKKVFLFISLITILAILIHTPSVYSQTSSTVNKNPPLTGDKTQADISFGSTASSPDQIWDITGNLTIDCLTSPCTISGTKTGAVFVEGDLNIKKNYVYGTAITGTVFVVKGNVNIDPSVTRIDAVIISQGAICTAYDLTNSACNVTTSSPLTINGSLISLNPDKPILFKRALTDNSQPAEKINHQVKYLVILRDLISDTYQKWSEIP